ncbi:putative membrane protein [Algoriphagus sp. 4150]|nr:putative membrane protein [Algoriphagus sp. 4150]
MNDLNPSKSWASTPHHVEGVPPIIYLIFILFCLIVGLYVFYQIKKDKTKSHINSRLLKIEEILKSLKRPPHS